MCVSDRPGRGGGGEQGGTAGVICDGGRGGRGGWVGGWRARPRQSGQRRRERQVRRITQ